MSFAHASQQLEIFPAALVPVTTYAYVDGATGTGRIGQMEAAAHGFTAIIAGRTAGSVTVTLQARGSASGTWRDLGSSYQGTISADGQASLWPSEGGPLPAYLRAKIAPAGGFDGTVRVLYSYSPPNNDASV